MFTADELAAMAAADAAIEAEFADEAAAYRLAREDTGYAAELDELARADGLTNREAAARRKAAAYQKAYYEANQKRLKPLDALRIYRKAHGYTQVDLGRLLGVSQRTISYWESGSIPPDQAKLAAIGIMIGGDT